MEMKAVMAKEKVCGEGEWNIRLHQDSQKKRAIILLDLEGGDWGNVQGPPPGRVGRWGHGGAFSLRSGKGPTRQGRKKDYSR